MEHHASLVTWQQVARRTGAELRFVELTDDGHLDVEHAKSLIDDDVELVSVPHVSNVLGTVNPVSTFADLADDAGAALLVDGAQSAPTRPVDVEEMGADFFTFSGHKMAGPTGIGGLYGRKELLEEMEPFMYGGEMIRHVTFDRSTWNELPWKFEAGTPPIAEAIALAAAVDYLDDLGMDWVREHEDRLAQYALERLSARENVETYGPGPGEERTGLVSFNVDGVHGHDLSSVLNEQGIAVRTGDHCTQPLHDRLDVPGSVRASFYVYNTTEEVDRLLEAITDAEEKVEAQLSSDRYADRLYEHHRNPRNSGGLSEPSLVKSSEETSCGDDGEFHVDVAPDGTIEAIAFESESCAVSRAVASLISEYLEGRTVQDAAEMEGEVASMLDGQYPELRRDCVIGPEDVIREAAREYLETGDVETLSAP